MHELGIDISGQQSKSVKGFLGQSFSYVIAVCDRPLERCPIFPFALRRLEWNFRDPVAVGGGEDLQRRAFRQVRDQIRDRIEVFLRDGG